MSPAACRHGATRALAPAGVLVPDLWSDALCLERCVAATGASKEAAEFKFCDFLNQNSLFC
jgi:hypothetical protein